VTLSALSGTVLFSLSGDGVLLLTLNRPERNNAWTVEMERTLHDLLFQAAASDEVVAVVLTGAGKSFCPGFDSESLAARAGGSPVSAEGRTQLTLPAAIPKPVVCAINGACAGIGLSTALLCDVRLASESARLSTAFSKRGLAAEEGISWILPRMIGHAAALELLLSSRAVTGTEAAALGMVHRAVAPDDLVPAALAYAANLAQNCSPASMAAIKGQVYADWNRGLPDARVDARRITLDLSDGDDFREGVQSFLDRRPPSFARRSTPLDPADYAIDE
jgi:enoyl-CoA hydratase/carnithine racemase